MRLPKIYECRRSLEGIEHAGLDLDAGSRATLMALGESQGMRTD
ncbi:MAG: hypothetical protein ACKOWG_06945 [Planctomycetia bacterium]